jgi:hypothetical protein
MAGYGGTQLWSQHLEAEAGGSRVPGQSRLHSETLSQKNKPKTTFLPSLFLRVRNTGAAGWFWLSLSLDYSQAGQLGCSHCTAPWELENPLAGSFL